MIIGEVLYKLGVIATSLILSMATLVRPATAGGDVEYGEYLSSECVTCHQANSKDAKIPSIHGMDEEGMAGILKLYRAKELENESMQTVTKRLTDEDIAALAAYFSTLPIAE